MKLSKIITKDTKIGYILKGYMICPESWVTYLSYLKKWKETNKKKLSVTLVTKKNVLYILKIYDKHLTSFSKVHRVLKVKKVEKERLNLYIKLNNKL